MQFILPLKNDVLQLKIKPCTCIKKPPCHCNKDFKFKRNVTTLVKVLLIRVIRICNLMVILGILSPVTYKLSERMPARYMYTEEHAYSCKY